ncbi:MAG: ankyrin repeat domain-containing protein [Phycisphaeraceae bacterium]|nr:ankyrin repeat domain-containing protein [Phycisphaeraceae bacterium]
MSRTNQSDRSTLGLTMRAMVLLGLAAALVIAFLMGRELGGADGPPGNAARAATPATGLFEAVVRKDAAGVKAALASGADVNGTLPEGAAPASRAGMTALMVACFEGSEGCVAALLDAGARTDARAADGRTALIFAAGWGGAGCVERLLAKGAAPDARAADGMTALMFAAARGDVESVRALLSAGARVDERNKWRQTALMAAARNGSIEKVGALLEAGASVDLADQFGDTALSIAASSTYADDAVVRTLLRAGAMPDQADNDGVTALMKAAEAGDEAKVAALLDAGASVTLKDRANGWTARDWAAKRDDEQGRAVAEMLGRIGR